MIICGLKLTHDGAVALIDDDRLVFSVEMEKIGNAPRYSAVPDLGVVPGLLASFGYQLADVDQWVIDGWDGDKGGHVETSDQGRAVELAVGPYRESEAFPELARPGFAGDFTIDGRPLTYTSYSHAAGHVMSTYCSSPFAERGEPSFVLIWDGGMFPMLYWCDPAAGVSNLGPLFPLIGHTYATAAHHFGPFRRATQSANVDDLSVAGKLMAYIALGRVRESVVAVLRATFEELFESDAEPAVTYRREVRGYGSLFEPSMPPLHRFFRTARERLEPTGVSDEDVLASVHQFLQELLAERVTERMAERNGEGSWNLSFAGGCALNIKWNSALRALPNVRAMWVPPFPNDSGSAIGAAALGMVRHTGPRALSWHARLGPALLPATDLPAGWTSTPCGPEELAEVLHRTGEPVVVLDGRAELGPRALGGRSILAAPTSAAMKDLLNEIKDRASYRPVAPICLVEEAPQIFDPGTPDPYMLFDHAVRPQWLDRIPAVVHLDGTARLQTVAAADDAFLAQVLTAYHRLSGIPVLCNTSANLNGSGFFPDVASAMAWGRIDRIWSEGVLHQRVAG
ncbi:carbamoyltransferase N-terminal domain-containing protein [Kitasatospora sp. NBC_01266]|uniref:carbamoyltransferase N-terminal domain-containing protein n=1 Tax=Kitasatospora sp. NBC_01266 TaxID=2903572 RepID=UPI002E329B4C|nr:carbamoyltransferase N-terminal domain-containing protein [Kitasatospora sp. NBC_01266]